MQQKCIRTDNVKKDSLKITEVSCRLPPNPTKARKLELGDVFRVDCHDSYFRKFNRPKTVGGITHNCVIGWKNGTLDRKCYVS